MENKIAFLILHYKVIEETIQCIESILTNYSNYNIEIIVVDNGSNNGTGDLLANKYKDIKNIHVIINEENLGFAKGNNVGFKFAKELKAKFIVMTNNDIIFMQKDFCKLIENEYKKYDYAVLGPRVMLPGNNISKYNPRIKSKNKQIFYLFVLYVRLILAYLHLEFIFKKLINTKRSFVDFKTDELKLNVPVYGCCMVFSSNYINKFDGLDDRTFMFCEEDLLYLRLIKNKMLEIYDPNLEVLHNHSVSINKSFKNSRQKEIFVVTNLIKSNKILLKELKNIE